MGRKRGGRLLNFDHGDSVQRSQALGGWEAAKEDGDTRRLMIDVGQQCMHLMEI
jgi:hypothetical protein